MTLPASFLQRPIAHRGYHDRSAGRVENSLASIDAALDAGYGIEIDIQAARDGTPMVFHDYDLRRLTLETGPVAQRSPAELGAIPLKDDRGTIPTLAEVLDRVAGKAPLLIEVKDQDGALGSETGKLGAAIAELLRPYQGDAALMSFNPHHMAEFSRILPEIPRGLVTDPFTHEDWPTVPAPTRERLRDIPDLDHVGGSFISHNVAHLADPRVSELKNSDKAIFCWTVRSPEMEAEARKIADNITFEGYAA